MKTKKMQGQPIELTDPQKKSVATLKNYLHKGLREGALAAVEVHKIYLSAGGESLNPKKIRLGGMTFAVFCRTKLDCTPARVSQLESFHYLVERFLNAGVDEDDLPKNERIARAILTVIDERQCEVWKGYINAFKSQRDSSSLRKFIKENFKDALKPKKGAVEPVQLDQADASQNQVARLASDEVSDGLENKAQVLTTVNTEQPKNEETAAVVETNETIQSAKDSPLIAEMTPDQIKLRMSKCKRGCKEYKELHSLLMNGGAKETSPAAAEPTPEEEAAVDAAFKSLDLSTLSPEDAEEVKSLVTAG